MKLGRWEKIFLGVYFFWFGAGLIATVIQLQPLTAENSDWTEGTRLFVNGCLAMGDPLLMVLATINTYFVIVRHWGLKESRKWALSVMGVGAAIETVGAVTGWPFGVYTYTNNFGWKIGGVLPFAIPLAWLVIVTCLLWIWRDFFPYITGRQEASMVALLATGFDYVMEPFATKIKAYWYWEMGTIPWQNYLSWWVITFGMVLFFAPKPSVSMLRDWRPLIIVGTMLTLFLAGRWVHGI